MASAWTTRQLFLTTDAPGKVGAAGVTNAANIRLLWSLSPFRMNGYKFANHST